MIEMIALTIKCHFLVNNLLIELNIIENWPNPSIIEAKSLISSPAAGNKQ